MIRTVLHAVFGLCMGLVAYTLYECGDYFHMVLIIVAMLAACLISLGVGE